MNHFILYSKKDFLSLLDDLLKILMYVIFQANFEKLYMFEKTFQWVMGKLNFEE